MHFQGVLFSLATVAVAKELSKDQVKAAKLYDSGIRHANNVALKLVCASTMQIAHRDTNFILGNLGSAKSSREI
jgi:hypothetical protein